MSKTLGESVKVTAGLAPAALAAGALTPLIIDRFGFEDAVVHLKVGVATGSPATQGVSLKVQTGDDPAGGDMADVSGDVIAALTVDNAEAELDLDLTGYKRYLQVSGTVAFTGGSSPKIPVAVTVALGGSRAIPV